MCLQQYRPGREGPEGWSSGLWGSPERTPRVSVQSLGPAPHPRPWGVSGRWWQPRPHLPPPMTSCEGASVHGRQLWGASWWRAAGSGHGRGWLQPYVLLSVWELILQGRTYFLRWRGWAGPSTERKLSERGLRDRKTHACQKRREVPRRAGWPRGPEGLELNPEGDRKSVV